MILGVYMFYWVLLHLARDYINKLLVTSLTPLTLFEQDDYQREIAIVCCDLGDLYLRKAEYPQAQAVLRRSLKYC